MSINNVAIVGGTHGNEYTGPYLLKVLEHRLHEIPHTTFEVTTLLANPKAFEKNVRFVDDDLNRSFLIKDLSDNSLSHYEANRAKVINAALGPKESPKTDLLIDIHSTTANMGVTVILTKENPLNLQLAL